MEMQVGNERGPEAVDEDHQPEPRRRIRAHEQAQRRALERGATVHEVPQLLRHREHPLRKRQPLCVGAKPEPTACYIEIGSLYESLWRHRHRGREVRP